MTKAIRSAICAAFFLSAAGPVEAAQAVYPAKGQSAKKQASDEQACSSWAVQQSGFDPAKPPPPTAVAKGATGSGAGVKGAVVGGGIGAVSGGNAAEGAVAGAVAGRVIKRNKNRQEAKAINNANAQQVQAGYDAYERARGACLTGRGYTVK
jgi:outer membrane lipoprotein SlyB